MAQIEYGRRDIHPFVESFGDEEPDEHADDLTSAMTEDQVGATRH